MACSVDDCDRDVKARGMCSPHYDSWRYKGGEVNNGGPALAKRRWNLAELSLCWCRLCGMWKHADLFSISTKASTGADGRCKDCAREYAARQSPDDPVGWTRVRANRVRRLYGITSWEWEAMFDRQGRQCYLCYSPDPRSSRGWSTDHDHATGEVIGIACNPCNSAEGHLGRVYAQGGLAAMERVMTEVLRRRRDGDECLIN